jgi:hypothetical protein
MTAALPSPRTSNGPLTGRSERPVQFGVDVDGRRTERIRREHTPTTTDTRCGSTETELLHISFADLRDAVIVAVSIFTIFYLGSLAQRMGAH